MKTVDAQNAESNDHMGCMEYQSIGSHLSYGAGVLSFDRPPYTKFNG